MKIGFCHTLLIGFPTRTVHDTYYILLVWFVWNSAW